MTDGHLLWPTVICHLWGCVCPSSAAHYSRYIPILQEFRFPRLAVCLLRGTGLSVVRGLPRSLYLNSLGFLLPVLSICHIRGDKWSPSQSNFFCWGSISVILAFFYHYLYIFYRFFIVIDQNWKYELLCWYVHNTYMETSKEQITMSDKMKNNTSILLTIGFLNWR